MKQQVPGLVPFNSAVTDVTVYLFSTNDDKQKAESECPIEFPFWLSSWPQRLLKEEALLNVDVDSSQKSNFALLCTF